MSWNDEWNNNFGSNDNQNDNFGSNDNQNDNQNDNDDLASLLSTESEDRELAELMNRDSEDSYSDSVDSNEANDSRSDTGINDSDESVSEETELVDTLTKIENSFISAPTNLKNDPVLSERDMYHVYNVMLVLEQCSETVESWIQKTLGVQGKTIRRAIAIVQMDTKEFDNKISSISALKSIYDAVNIKEGQDPLEVAIQTISRVTDMQEDERSNMIVLAKKLANDTEGVKRLSITKSSSPADLVSEIRTAMTGDNNISDKVMYLDKVFDTLRKAMDK